VSFENEEVYENSILWVGDTGATCHMICNDSGLFDYKRVTDELNVADGRALKVEKLGS
jgi:hypothetical protein